MKTLIAMLAICFSLTLSAEGLETINLNFTLDDSDALEFGFPHEMILKEIKVNPSLFGESTVRMTGTANGQDFDLVRVIKLKESEANQVIVEADVWDHHDGGYSCDEEIIQKVKLTFKVEKSGQHKTSEHHFKAERLYTYDNCHSPYSVREFYYSLMK